MANLYDIERRLCNLERASKPADRGCLAILWEMTVMGVVIWSIMATVGWTLFFGVPTVAWYRKTQMTDEQKQEAWDQYRTDPLKKIVGDPVKPDEKPEAPK